MVAGLVRAGLMLAWSLVKTLLARAFGRKDGVPAFEEKYRADRLPALTASERDELTTFGGCVACGLCDAGEGERIAASKGAYPGLMQLVLASSRSMPDFDAAKLGFAYVPDTVLAEKEALCPSAIPFRRLARFVRAKASTPAT